MSARTAATFKPGISHYKQFCVTHAVPLLSPSEEDVICFATLLSHSKSLSTIRVYLSAVRHFLLCENKPITSLHSARLAAVLRGIERRQPSATVKRREIKLEELGKIQQYLVHSNYSDQDRAMLWACILTAFHGLLRASEFLAPGPQATDKNRTLLWEAVVITDTSVTLQLKVTKTAQQGDGGVVEMYATGDNRCPVAAMTGLQTRPDKQLADTGVCFRKWKLLDKGRAHENTSPGNELNPGKLTLVAHWWSHPHGRKRSR